MGAACSSAPATAVAEDNDRPPVAMSTIARSSKHGGNDLTHLMKIDRSKLDPPLDERAMFSLMHSWDLVRAQIRNTGKLIFVRLVQQEPMTVG